MFNFIISVSVAENLVDDIATIAQHQPFRSTEPDFGKDMFIFC